MYTKIILLTIASIALAYNKPMPISNNLLCRRAILNIIGKSPAIVPYIQIKESLAQPSEENKPLTEEEMKEYNKLLLEAERIKSIIDANVNASKKALALDEENDLEKYIKQKGLR